MTEAEKNNYFTAGELANLFGISKQALLYYDKVDLLTPILVADNGYRYYSLEQYLDLEIIVNLRALNIAISDIKSYLKERSKEDFLNILQKKKAECEAIIQENEHISKCIDSVYSNATAKEVILFEQPLLTLQDERPLNITPVSLADDAKERMILFTHHAQDIFHSRKSFEKHVGWVITQADIFDNDIPNKTHAYFSFTPASFDAQENTCQEMLPAGLYVEIYFKGTYYENADKLSKMLKNFLQLNELAPLGDVYIQPIENNIFHNDTSKFINKIFLQVEKNKSTLKCSYINYI